MGCECKLSFILNGFYQCVWRERGRKGQTSKPEKVSFFFVFLIFVFTAMWLYFFSILHNNFSDIDEFIFESVGFYFHWYLVLLICSILVLLYVLVVFVSGLYLWFVNYALRLSVCNKIFLPISLTLGILGFVLIKLLFSEQYDAASASFEITGPFLQISVILLYACFAWYIAYISLQANQAIKIMVLIIYTVFFIFLLTIPLWLFSSCIGSGIDANPKPLLFGHRGSCKYAPENTMLAFQDSLSCGDFAFETDIRLSTDGVPFLMHDSDLKRTTDVGKVFPDRKDNRAETFTWDELQQLNAGSWFLSDNPFLTNHLLSAEKKNKIAAQKIPTLFEVTQLASVHNRSIIFDLRSPPSNHSTSNTFVNITVNTLLNSGINQSLVFWLYGFSDQVNITGVAPGFKIVSTRPSADSAADAFNLLFSDVTAEDLSYNIPIISYVISDKWAFTRAWCQNVWAVTTNNNCELNQVSKPGWILMRNQYLVIYIIIDLLSFLILLGALFWHNKNKITSSIIESEIGNIDNLGYDMINIT